MPMLTLSLTLSLTISLASQRRMASVPANSRRARLTLRQGAPSPSRTRSNLGIRST